MRDWEQTKPPLPGIKVVIVADNLLYQEQRGWKQTILIERLGADNSPISGICREAGADKPYLPGIKRWEQTDIFFTRYRKAGSRRMSPLPGTERLEADQSPNKAQKGCKQTSFLYQV